ncbi:MAG TPA: DUF4830 domain-containing protein [Candidatus Caccousia avicola]|uniref:DUF4830 domain-containing protein n=1 Tax=Candidatus Caccousia avicola TaxID=2840721 RepID=A0A9D1AKK5_9FIRM|nr:DUF4830 domain-containing protein [Candidatus Caccousia avicola]
MFVVSVKTGKRRMILALAAVLVILTAALAAGKLLGGAQAAQSLPAGETNEQRLAFLLGYGWEADTEAVEVREITIPDVFDDVYLKYNEVQKAQGMDLERYRGKTCRQWIYNVTNYPAQGTVHASLLVLDGKIIGGDLSSTELDGFLCAFNGEGAELPWSVPSEIPETASSASTSETASSEPAASAVSSGTESAVSAAEAAAEPIPDDAWPID